MPRTVGSRTRAGQPGRRAGRPAVVASPPTARVLDVIELLARSADRSFTLAQIVRELRITWATGHAILATLVERGWASRDETDKSFRLGPALAVASDEAVAARPLGRLVRRAADDLSRELAMGASVMERTTDTVTITHFVVSDGSNLTGQAGDRIPYAAPFGQGFAAWEPSAARRAWLERSAITSESVAKRLEAVLSAVRASGYTVQLMSPEMARAIHVIGVLREDSFSVAMRKVVDRLLAEVVTQTHLPGERRAAGKLHVSTIAAPVFDERGRVALNVAVHPFEKLSPAGIERIAAVLTRVTRALSVGAAPADD